MDGGGPARPSLLLLSGPPAVGKTTVGQEIERLTGFRLFHLHQIVDLVTAYFPYDESPGSSYRRLVIPYRTRFYEEAARNGLDIISTGWRRDTPEDEEILRGYVEPFLACSGRVYVAELTATVETRLARNKTENRRRLKRVDWSTDAYLRQDDELHDYGGAAFPVDLPFVRLETDDLSAAETAARICAHFGLPRLNGEG